MCGLGITSGHLLCLPTYFSSCSTECTAHTGMCFGTASLYTAAHATCTRTHHHHHHHMLGTHQGRCWSYKICQSDLLVTRRDDPRGCRAIKIRSYCLKSQPLGNSQGVLCGRWLISICCFVRFWRKIRWFQKLTQGAKLGTNMTFFF